MAKTRVLIIDDESRATKLVKIALESMGQFEVFEQNDGGKGLETAQNVRPDVVLLDIIMPGVDGSEVARQIQADPNLNRVVIIFLTAAVLPEETVARAGVIGGFPFIAKPYRIQELVTCMKQQLETRR